VKSAELLFHAARKTGAPLQAFVSSLVVGYYGAVTTEHIFSEDDPSATDFMGMVCRLWEEAADRFAELKARIVKLRTGVVLTREGGALAKMMVPIKFGLGSPLGSGKQYLPWIHIDDLVNIYLKAVKDAQMVGVCNAVSSEFVTNAEFMRAPAQVLHRPFFLPPIPNFLLKLLFGEMASTILEGSRVSAEEVQKARSHFQFFELAEALQYSLSRQTNSRQE